ncbi:unnamed protein product, partial [marine sediment metagenome]
KNTIFRNFISFESILTKDPSLSANKNKNPNVVLKVEGSSIEKR